jgi:hypothetical protein
VTTPASEYDLLVMTIAQTVFSHCSCGADDGAVAKRHRVHWHHGDHRASAMVVLKKSS